MRVRIDNSNLTLPSDSTFVRPSAARDSLTTVND